MIFAELRGKLGVDYSRAHERAEDLLTSTVFGLLRYLTPADGLLAILQRARPVRVENGTIVTRSDPNWLELDPVADISVEFWPYWPGYGEPDVLLTLRDRAAQPLSLVLIEAKLHSSKSGRAGVDDEPTDEGAADPDQLVRYWRGLQVLPGFPSVPRCIVYLTKHGAAPAEELTESVRRAPGIRLAWLSWRDVWAVADSAPRTNLPAADLARLLAYKGLKNFNGFGAAPWQPPPASHFWRRRGWFTWVQPWRGTAGTARFWGREERS
jgi:hypothetical protein